MMKYLSSFSILLTFTAIAIKINVDMQTYNAFKRLVPSDDAHPINIVNNSIVTAVIILVVSFGFAIFGLEKNNKLRKLALTFAILAVFYLLVPFGMFLVRN